MNQPRSFDYTPRFERITRTLEHGIDVDAIRLVYNEIADELVVFLVPDVEHSVAVDVDENGYLLLDPESEEVVGFQFDGFMSEVVLDRPQLLELASLAGIDQSSIDEARERIGERRFRQAAVESALRDVIHDSPVGR